jgi:tetratricopeptide (TPR) repeat protein
LFLIGSSLGAKADQFYFTWSCPGCANVGMKTSDIEFFSTEKACKNARAASIESNQYVGGGQGYHPSACARRRTASPGRQRYSSGSGALNQSASNLGTALGNLFLNLLFSPSPPTQVARAPSAPKPPPPSPQTIEFDRLADVARAAAEAGDHQKAIQVLTDALKNTNNVAPRSTGSAHLQLCDAYMALGEFSNAAAAGTDAVQAFDEDFWRSHARTCGGYAYLEGGEFDLVVALLQGSVKSPRRNTSKVKYAPSANDSFQHQMLAFAYMELEQYDDALNAARNASAWRPSPALDQNIALLLVAAEQYDLALDQVDHILSENPDDFQSLKLKGMIFVSSEQYEKAVQPLRKAYEIDPNDRNVVLALANVSYSLQRNAEAEEFFGKLTEIEPENPKFRSTLAMLKMSRDDYEGAFSEYERYSALAPEDPKGPRGAAYALLALEDYEAAATQFKKAIALKPHDYDLHKQYATTLSIANDSDAAMTQYELMMEEFPDDTFAFLQFATEATFGDRPIEARAALSRAIELDPDNEQSFGLLATSYLYTDEVQAASDVLEIAVALGGDQSKYAKMLQGVQKMPGVEISAEHCTPWYEQSNNSEWRTCVDEQGAQYCQIASNETVSRVDCQN